MNVGKLLVGLERGFVIIGDTVDAFAAPNGLMRVQILAELAGQLESLAILIINFVLVLIFDRPQDDDVGSVKGTTFTKVLDLVEFRRVVVQVLELKVFQRVELEVLILERTDADFLVATSVDTFQGPTAPGHVQEST